jgi:glycosyltransferase involved in cell wall biosynthesis
LQQKAPLRSHVSAGFSNLRIAVVSPFVDKHHGTERAVAELLERLVHFYGYDVYLYAQRVEDMTSSVTHVTQTAKTQAGSVHWRRVPSISGPHLIQFIWWYWQNQRVRRKDVARSGAEFDVILSAGINCSDADLILVHAVFHRLAELQKQAGSRGLRAWHRSLYYGLLRRLERKIYANRRTALAAVSQRTAHQICHYLGRSDVRVIPNGVDGQVFNPAARESLRNAVRLRWNFADTEVVALLVGNDWRNKGLATLLEATAKCRKLPLRLLIVGADDPSDWHTAISRLDLEQKVSFLRPSPNVLEFYAAADILAAPSLEDSFNLPALEAMACGLPVITSSYAGVSSLLHHGQDCFVLERPHDFDTLAVHLANLCNDKSLRLSLGAQAVRTASQFTWEGSVDLIVKLIEDVRAKKHDSHAQRPHS